MTGFFSYMKAISSGRRAIFSDRRAIFSDRTAKKIDRAGSSACLGGLFLKRSPEETWREKVLIGRL